MSKTQRNDDSGGYCSLSLPTNLNDDKSISTPSAEPFASISATALLAEDVTHSGWIRKEGFGIKTWKNRFMVLHHGCVYYFKATDSGSPQGKFALNGCRCETAPERDSVDRFPYVFKVVPDNEIARTYYFSSPSRAEMEGWIEKINNDIKLYCTSSTATYDYADPFEHSSSKVSTVPRQMPPVPMRSVISLRGTGNAHSPIFTINSPSVCTLPRSFPKNPPAKIPPPRLESDSDDSGDESPSEQIYLKVIADEDEITMSEEFNQRLQPSKPPPIPPPKPPPKPPKVEHDEEKDEYLPSGCYQPNLHKNQAKVFLELSRDVGGYIVHSSQTSDTKLVLSVWMSAGVKRYLIFKRNDMLTLYPSLSEEQFPNLYSLIKFYHSNPLPKSSQCLIAPFSP